jgi:hypothetical protein
MAKPAKQYVFKVPDDAKVHLPLEILYPDRWDRSSPEVKLLCERYGIPPTEARPGLLGTYGGGEINWKRLALMLAFKHEPSWKLKKKPGAKTKDLRDFMLILDVEHLQQKNTFNLDKDAAALRTLIQSSPRWKGDNQRTLNNELIKARKNPKVLATLAQWRGEADARGVDLWEWMDKAHPHPVTSWAAETERWLKSAPKLASRK